MASKSVDINEHHVILLTLLEEAEIFLVVEMFSSLCNSDAVCCGRCCDVVVQDVVVRYVCTELLIVRLLRQFSAHQPISVSSKVVNAPPITHEGERP
jgi:hypothetical protein